MAVKSKQDSNTSSRFIRAVNVESDTHNDHALDDYVLTATGRSVLRRLGPAIGKSHPSRAWTLTGPYGTGKSAFAVFAANLFAQAKGNGSRRARQILRDSDEELAKELLRSGRGSAQGLLPITVTGSREPLDRAILRGLYDSLTHFANGHGKGVVRDVKKALEESKSAKPVSARRLTDLLSATIDKVCTPASKFKGIFIVVDELGKLLEYANNNPVRGDVAVLQNIAEFASRSDDPCLFLTILHQDFGAYANRLSAQDKAEWDKVRGRFEDIAFEEPADEMLRLISRALSLDSARGNGATTQRRGFASACQAAWDLGLAPGSMTKAEFVRSLQACWPLHPLVTTSLGNVFRKLGQNERSAFSFLFSAEPFGLRDFKNTASNGELYGPDKLYDYLGQSLREELFASPRAKRWAETETVLENHSDLNAEEAFLVKTIGLINAVGQSEKVRATKKVLGFAGHSILGSKSPDASLKSLVSRKAVIPRRYNGTYALWEGSDVDIDAELRRASNQLGASTDTARLASQYFDPRPIVARRHSYQKGALRYFPVRFLSPDEFNNSPPQEDELSILIIPASTEAERKRCTKAARRPEYKERSNILACIPALDDAFAKQVQDLACLEWVQQHAVALEGDRTARREVAVQIEGVRRRLHSALEEMLDPCGPSETNASWYQSGKKVSFHSRRDLQNRLSAICDDVYSLSPRLHNELINRRDLSSAAAAARRNLIERMIINSTEESLGIEGAPPEKSMYLSLLKEPGIHRKDGEGWTFKQPKPSADDGIRALWSAIRDFFSETEKKMLPVSSLVERLSRPPYGTLAGPIPVLVCAALLAYDDEVALYKEGSFVPILNVPDLELLMKDPSRYAVQKWRISGVRANVFEQLAKLMERDVAGDKVGKPQILQIVRPLLKLVGSLNDYTMRTVAISDRAAAIRQTLSKASQPDALLFTDLPKACGLQPFRARQRVDKKQVRDFVKRLRSGLGELQQCYSRLLNEIAGAIRVSFRIDAGGAALDDLRRELTDRARAVGDCKGDPSLKSFVARVRETDLEDEQWLETVASVLAMKNPPVWRDADRERFDEVLANTARLFQHVESIAFGESTTSSTYEAVRIGITSADAAEIERVVRITARQKKTVEVIERKLETAIEKVKGAQDNDLVLAAMARMAQRRIT